MRHEFLTCLIVGMQYCQNTLDLGVVPTFESTAIPLPRLVPNTLDSLEVGQGSYLCLVHIGPCLHALEQGSN